MSVCSSAITVNESSNVTCLCKAERDNTPEAPSVTWYDEDGNQISGVGEGMKELNLNNIKRNQAGRYTCKADSYGLKQENSIQVNVNCKYIACVLVPNHFQRKCHLKVMLHGTTFNNNSKCKLGVNQSDHALPHLHCELLLKVIPCSIRLKGELARED